MNTTFIKIASLLTFASSALLAEHIREDWVRKDLKGAALVGGLVPIENQTFESIKAVLSEEGPDDDHQLGLGGRLFKLKRYGGYTTVYLEAFAYNGRLGQFKVGVEARPADWRLIRQRVMKSWTDSGGPKYECDVGGCFYRGSDERIIQGYRQAVSAALGATEELAVPPAIAADYDYLMTPFEVILVGPGPCGYSGAVLRGRRAIDALAVRGRVDLITNVLRGPNPGARLYALSALLKLQQYGAHLALDVLKVMADVRNLNAPVSTCVGCIVTSNSSAEEALRVLTDPE